MSSDSLQLKLFRHQAIDASAQRWLGSVRVVTSPGIGSLVIVAILACTLLVGATFVIEVPERIRANGVLLPIGRILKVRAERSGIVDRLFILDGELVSRSQELLSISGQRHADSNLSDFQVRTKSLQRELELLEISGAEEIRKAKDSIRIIDARSKLTKRRLRVADQSFELQQRLWTLATQRLRRVEVLAESTTVPAQDVEEQISLALHAESQMYDAEQQILILREQIAMQERELDSLAAEATLVQARAGMRREALLREVSKLAAERATRMTAPDGGEIAGLLIREGSTVAAGQLLLSIIEPDSHLDAFIYIGAESAGRVVVGQSVELELQAFPHQVYGTISAVVASISTVPIPAKSVDAPLASSGSVFEIRANFDAKSIAANGEHWQLAAGTALQADLISERWPLYRWFMRAAKTRS